MNPFYSSFGMDPLRHHWGLSSPLFGNARSDPFAAARRDDHDDFDYYYRVNPGGRPEVHVSQPPLFQPYHHQYYYSPDHHLHRTASPPPPRPLRPHVSVSSITLDRQPGPALFTSQSGRVTPGSDIARRRRTRRSTRPVLSQDHQVPLETRSFGTGVATRRSTSPSTRRSSSRGRWSSGRSDLSLATYSTRSTSTLSSGGEDEDEDDGEDDDGDDDEDPMREGSGLLRTALRRPRVSYLYRGRRLDDEWPFLSGDDGDHDGEGEGNPVYELRMGVQDSGFARGHRRSRSYGDEPGPLFSDRRNHRKSSRSSRGTSRSDPIPLVSAGGAPEIPVPVAAEVAAEELLGNGRARATRRPSPFGGGSGRGQAKTSAGGSAFSRHRSTSRHPPPPPRYNWVFVLVLSWEFHDLSRDDIPPGVPGAEELTSLDEEAERLWATLGARYGYAVEEYRIPMRSSLARLRARLRRFFEHAADDALLIVYYHGHGARDDRNELVLSSHEHPWNPAFAQLAAVELYDALASGQACPLHGVTRLQELQMKYKRFRRVSAVSWADIRGLLVACPSDMLLILDCCAAGGAATGLGEHMDANNNNTGSSQNSNQANSFNASGMNWSYFSQRQQHYHHHHHKPKAFGHRSGGASTGRSARDGEGISGNERVYTKHLYAACGFESRTRDAMTSVMCDVMDEFAAGLYDGAHGGGRSREGGGGDHAGGDDDDDDGGGEASVGGGGGPPRRRTRRRSRSGGSVGAGGELTTKRLHQIMEERLQQTATGSQPIFKQLLPRDPEQYITLPNLRRPVLGRGGGGGGGIGGSYRDAGRKGWRSRSRSSGRTRGRRRQEGFEMRGEPLTGYLSP